MKKSMTVEQVVRRVKGGQCAVAELLGVSQSAISQRIKRGNNFAIEECPKVADAAGVTLYDLRPDWFKSTVSDR